MSDDGLLEKLYDKMEKLDTKIDKLTSDQSDMKVIAAKQEENLKIHMKRSDLLEEGMDLIRKDFKPIQTHIAVVGAVAKGIGLAASLAAIVRVISEFI